MAVVLGMLACQRGDPLPEPSASIRERAAGGQRLRAIWLRAESDAAQFLTFEDTKLGIRCAFGVAGDGVMRCLPDDVFDVYRVVPLDGGRQAAELATREHGRGWRLDACPARLVIYRRGAPVPGAAAGTHEIEEVPPATFVGAAIETAPAGAAKVPLSARTLRADDGSLAHGGWHDGGLGVPCDFRDLEYQPGTGALPSPLRCAPEEAWFSELEGPFADAACSRPAAATYGGRCPGDRFATLSAPGSCRGRSFVHRVGPPLDQAFERVRLCSPVWRQPAGLGFSEIGARVDDQALPAGRLVAGDERGRLRTLWLETGAGRVVAGLWDSELEAACSPQQEQGVWRCTPAEDLIQAVPGASYADAACSQPLVTDWTAGCRRPRIVQSRDGSLDFWRVGERHDGPLWFLSSNDRVCRPSERPAGGVAYHLGAAIPAGSLAVLLEQRR